MVFFSRTFPRSQKSAESGRQCGDGPAGGVSTLGSQRMAHARVVESSTPAAYELEESSSSEEAHEEDHSVDEYGLTWIMTPAETGRSGGASLVGRWRRRGGGGEAGDVFNVFSQDKVLQRLVEHIIVDFSWAWTGFNRAPRGAEPCGVGLVCRSPT